MVRKIFNGYDPPYPLILSVFSLLLVYRILFIVDIPL